MEKTLKIFKYIEYTYLLHRLKNVRFFFYLRTISLDDMPYCISLYIVINKSLDMSHGKNNERKSKYDVCLCRLRHTP